MPVNKIPVFLPISTSTARRRDKRILAQYLPDPDLDNLRVILVDEKSIGAKHHYMTVVINGETGEVLHLAEGKKKASLVSFFQKLSPKQIKKVKAAGIDRAGAYKSVIQQYAPRHRLSMTNSISSATSTLQLTRCAAQSGEGQAKKTNVS
jgi:transposase